MLKRGTSSYELEKKRLEAQADAAGDKFRRDGDAASWSAWQGALARLSEFLRWHG